MKKKCPNSENIIRTTLVDFWEEALMLVFWFYTLPGTLVNTRYTSPAPSDLGLLAVE